MEHHTQYMQSYLYKYVTGSERNQLLLVLFVAFLLRFYVFIVTPLIGTDSFVYLEQAKSLAEERFSDALKEGDDILYPLLMSWVYSVTLDYETAGKVVSLVFGTATVIPFYYLTKRFFGHNIAILSCLFLSLNPDHVRESADIMTEPTYIFFFVSAVLLGWKAISQVKYQYILLTVLCVWLAFFTRTEGIGLLAVMLPWLFVYNCRKINSRLVDLALKGILIIIGFIILSIPVVYFITKETDNGVGVVSKFGWILEEEIPPRGHPLGGIEARDTSESDSEELEHWSRGRKYHLVAFYVLNELFKVGFIPFLPFVLSGLFVLTLRTTDSQALKGLENGFFAIVRELWSFIGRRLVFIRLRLYSGNTLGELFLISIVGVYFLAVYLRVLNTHDMCGRWLLSSAIISLVWAGVGFQVISNTLTRIAPGLSKTSFHWQRASIILLCLLLSISMPKIMHIKRKAEVAKKEAGLWIKKNARKKPVVIMGLAKDMEKVAFYADARYELRPVASYSNLLEHTVEARVDYLVLCSERYTKEFIDAIEWGRFRSCERM